MTWGIECTWTERGLDCTGWFRERRTRKIKECGSKEETKRFIRLVHASDPFDTIMVARVLRP